MLGSNYEIQVYFVSVACLLLKKGGTGYPVPPLKGISDDYFDKYAVSGV